MSGYFDHIDPIKYEGPDSENPLAFKYYNPDQILLGKRMEDHLRVAACYWHTFCWDGFDVFGGGTFNRPWHGPVNDQAAAEGKLNAAFEFFDRLGQPFFCFHDTDVMAAAETPKEHVENFAAIVDVIEAKMATSRTKLLWGTANMFSHPRYMAGASTNPNPDVVAFSALQVKHAMEATHRLGGAGYVLWGGREGYDTLLNTNVGQEMEQLGRFVSMVVEHKHKIGFKGDIWIEPKPHEPTKHQYDRDVATVYGFLKTYGLENEVGVNIEPNHATLAGHSFEHEVEMANALGVFGSIDFNRGDPQNGWDTDQFPFDLRENTLALYYILKGGGFKNGGSNFDAKVRRQSSDLEDLFYGHIGGMDLLARALTNAVAMIESDQLQAFKDQRYAGWSSGIGRKMLNGEASLDDMAAQCADQNVSPTPVSGRQEHLENIVTLAVK
ncbi:xylose isomerase [Algimonas ampicilliniresistens]|uniref:Xylose isomerase n=1 Tax=Algimonas ampicilliniresistens TaxID=1298735 RepID=A0ABQ5V622_9PROT|nr:xylose isomerase [Algimonas ampicilliniresistens]GLQ22419.1 xylose isomerase [Algimonas ampicilliniresistens]